MHSRVSLIIMYLVEVVVVLILVGVVFSLRGVLTPASAGAALLPANSPTVPETTITPVHVQAPVQTVVASTPQASVQMNGPTVGKNAPANLEGKFQITYVGEFRDRIIFAASESDWNHAKGIYATIQFRVKNLQPVADSVARNYTLVAITDDGETIASDPAAEANAVWLYCQCDTPQKMIPPSGESVFVIAFDVPVSTHRLVIAPTRGGLADFFNGLPRFNVVDFDKVRALRR